MGVDKVTTQFGDGTTFPKTGDTLTMHYTGTLASDGTKFDSSLDRGSPFSFTIGVGQVIKGWDEGVAGMSLGEVAVLHISPDFGYGTQGGPPPLPRRPLCATLPACLPADRVSPLADGVAGAGGVIPPNASLEFEVELLGIGSTMAPARPEPTPHLTADNENPALPRVLLVGDSISMGYHSDVCSRLAGVANVYRPISINCGQTNRGVQLISEWLNQHGDRPWDVIHFVS
jgi:FK506-binding protein 1